MDETVGPKIRGTYTTTQRARLKRAIRELMTTRDIRDSEQLADILNEQAFRTPTDDPLTDKFVRDFCYRNGLSLRKLKRKRREMNGEEVKPRKKRAARAIAQAVIDDVRSSGRLPRAVLGILTDESLTDSQKVLMLRAYANL